MWLKKTAGYPENSQKYRGAIDIVKQKAKEKYSADISDESINEYYAEAMKKKIYGTPIKLLTKDEQTKVRELLVVYFINPTDANGENFKNYVRSINDFNSGKGGAVVAFVGKISPALCGKIV